MSLLENFGIVFSGGGGKGSWQIGVWQALEEKGLRAKAVSGTSVGALNAALYAQGDLSKGIQAWNSISRDQMLPIDGEQILKKLVTFAPKLMASTSFAGPIAKGVQVGMELIGVKKDVGVFSQKGLESIIEQNLDLSQNFDIPVMVCAHNKNTGFVKYFKLNDHAAQTKKKILLASSSIPVVFDDIEIDGEVYSDGGGDLRSVLTDEAFNDKWEFDNSPILPLAEQSHPLGIKTILLLALSKNELVQRPDYPGVRIFPLIPSEDLGGFLDGVMDFDAEHAEKRIEQGYRDALNWLEKIEGFAANESRLAEIWEDVLISQNECKANLAKLTATHQNGLQLTRGIKDFNQFLLEDNLEDDLTFIPAANPMENLISAKTMALIDSVEREKICKGVESLIAQNLNNSDKLHASALDAISALAPVESRAQWVEEQGFLSRIVHSATGHNQKISAQNEADLAKSHFASLTFLQQLQKQNILQFEQVASLQSQMSRCYYEIERVEGFVQSQFFEAYKTMALMWTKTRKSLREHASKIQTLERKVDQHQWALSLAAASFGGKTLAQMSPPEKLLALTFSFFKASKGQWNAQEMLVFESCVIEKLSEEKISLKDLALCLQGNSPLLEYTKAGLVIGRESNATDLQPVLMGQNESAIMGYEAPQNANLLACHTLAHLRLAGWKVPEKSIQSDLQKQWLDALDQIKEIASHEGGELVTAGFKDGWQSLKTEITKFHFKIPVMGAFSAGKSTLLNAFMGRELLGVALKPETALATELVYSPENQIQIFFEDGRVESYPLSAEKLSYLTEISQNNMGPKIKKLVVGVDASALAEFPDLCLVDMPGMDSGNPYHNEMIRNYMGEGIAWILCTPIDAGTVHQSTHDFLCEQGMYGSAIYGLVTKYDRFPPSQRDEIRQKISSDLGRLLGVALNCPMVSASNHDFEGLRSTLHQINQKKEQLFVELFAPKLEALKAEIIAALKLRLNRENLDAVAIDAEIQKVEHLKEKITDLLNRAEGDLASRVSSTAQSAAHDVYDVLARMRGTFKQQIKAGQDISAHLSSVAQNAAQMALHHRSKALFEPIQEQIRRYIRDEVGTVQNAALAVTGQAPIKVDTDSGFAGTTFAGIGAAIGMVIPIPGGALIGAALGWIAGKLSGNNNNEADQVVQQALENTKDAVKSPIENALSEMCRQFVGQLRTRIQAEFDKQNATIQKFKERKAESEAEFEKMKALREADLQALSNNTPKLISKGEAL